MNGGAGDPVRHEAERLVAAAIATLGGLAAGRGASFATGGPECCACPICKVIAAVREPSPEASERIATGVGDLATGIASMMRAFTAGAAGTDRSADPAPGGEPGPGGDVWHAATTQTTAPPSSAAAPAATPKPMAKKAVRKAPPTNVAGARTPAPNRQPDEGTEAGE